MTLSTLKPIAGTRIIQNKLETGQVNKTAVSFIPIILDNGEKSAIYINRNSAKERNGGEYHVH